MINWLIHRRLAAFEARWHYPMDHARALLAGSRRAFMAFARLAPAAALRDGVPRAAWHVAKLTVLLAEDCGACTQLALDMARAEGVPDALLRAVLADDAATLQQLDADAALAQAFARAWARREPALAACREALHQRIGARGLASLAMALTTARMFPQLKSALGQGEQCQRPRLGPDAPAPAAPRTNSGGHSPQVTP